MVVEIKSNCLEIQIIDRFYRMLVQFHSTLHWSDRYV